MDGEAVQGVLADLFGPEHIGDVDRPSPFSRTLAPKRGAGRPRGSQNVLTTEVKAWLLAQHRHPLGVMMEAYSMGPVEFALRLGMAPEQERDKDGVPVGEPYWPNDTLLEIAKLQLKMAEASARYFVSAAPQQVAVATQAGVNIRFEGVSVPARAGSGGEISAGEDGPTPFLGVEIRAKSDE